LGQGRGVKFPDGSILCIPGSERGSGGVPLLLPFGRRNHNGLRPGAEFAARSLLGGLALWRGEPMTLERIAPTGGRSRSTDASATGLAPASRRRASGTLVMAPRTGTRSPRNRLVARSIRRFAAHSRRLAAHRLRGSVRPPNESREILQEMALPEPCSIRSLKKTAYFTGMQVAITPKCFTNQ
jgi:hypothetical protein